MPGEYPGGDKIQGGLFVLFLTVWVLDSFLLLWTVWLNGLISIYVRIFIGTLFFGLSLYFIHASECDLVYTNRSGRHPSFSGVYRRCRHPMYLGVILFHIALGLFSLSVLVWVMIGCTCFWYNFLAKYEEGRLIRTYGEEYSKYCAKIPRWIPKLRI